MKKRPNIWSPSGVKISGAIYFYPELMMDTTGKVIRPTGSVYMYPEATGKVSPDLKRILEKLIKNRFK